jgi:hypothetical protein
MGYGEGEQRIVAGLQSCESMLQIAELLARPVRRIRRWR